MVTISQNDEAINIIIRAIEQYVDAVVREAHFDRTVKGVVTDVNNGVYSIKSGKETYTITSTATYSVGDTVYVLIAQNEPSNKIIIGKVV